MRPLVHERKKVDLAGYLAVRRRIAQVFGRHKLLRGLRSPRLKVGPATHQTTRELAVYIDAGARQVGTIPPGVPLRAEPAQSGFVRVRLPGIESALWVTEQDFAEARASSPQKPKLFEPPLHAAAPPILTAWCFTPGS